MTQVRIKNTREVFAVPLGSVLIVTPSRSTSSGRVTLNTSGVTPVGPWTVAGGASTTIGPFSSFVDLTVESISGTVFAEVTSAATLTAAQGAAGGQIAMNSPAQVAAGVPFASVPATDKPIIKYGSYTATGADMHIDVGFEPDFVIIKGSGKPALVGGKPYWYTGLTKFGNLVHNGADAVRAPALTRRGFIATAAFDATGNSGTTYHYVAVKDNGSGIFRATAYNGFRNKTSGAPDNQGTTSNAVSMDLLAGTSPSIVYLCRDYNLTGREGVWVTPTFAKKETAAAVDNTLVTLATDGTLALSTDISVNENDALGLGEGHNVASWHNPGLYWDLKTYTGNGGTQAIQVGGQVAGAIVIPQAAVAMEFWTGTMGTSSADGGATALNTGRLYASGAAVNVGGTCNQAGVTYSLLVMYVSDGVEKLRSLCQRPGVRLVASGGGIIKCGTDASLALAGTHSLEWIGRMTDSGAEQFLMGRGGNGSTGSRATPTAGSFNFALSYQRDPQGGLDVCTSDQFSNLNDTTHAQQRWRVGITLRPFEDYHLLYTHDGVDKWILYVNGVPWKWRRLPMSVFALNGITATTGLTMTFGGRVSSGTTAGNTDTTHRFGRIYNRVLTAAEVAQMYARNFLLVPLTDITDTSSALVEEWKFTDGTGSTVAATKSSANNGTITNGFFVLGQ